MINTVPHEGRRSTETAIKLFNEGRRCDVFFLQNFTSDNWDAFKEGNMNVYVKNRVTTTQRYWVENTTKIDFT